MGRGDGDGNDGEKRGVGGCRPATTTADGMDVGKRIPQPELELKPEGRKTDDEEEEEGGGESGDEDDDDDPNDEIRNKFMNHRDTFEILSLRRPRSHHHQSRDPPATRKPRRRGRATHLPHTAFQQILRHVDFQTYLSLRLVCRCWSAAVSYVRPVHVRVNVPMPERVPLDVDILRLVFRYLSHRDLQAATQTCRAWRDGAVAAAAGGGGFRRRSATDGFRTEGKPEEVGGEVPDGTTADIEDEDNDDGGGGGFKCRFTMSACGNFVLAVKRRDIYLCSVVVDSRPGPRLGTVSVPIPEAEKKKERRGRFRVLTRVACPGLVRAVGFDTSSAPERILIAAVLLVEEEGKAGKGEGKAGMGMGIVCEVRDVLSASARMKEKEKRRRECNDGDGDGDGLSESEKIHSTKQDNGYRHRHPLNLDLELEKEEEEQEEEKVTLLLPSEGNDAIRTCDPSSSSFPSLFRAIAEHAEQHAIPLAQGPYFFYPSVCPDAYAHGYGDEHGEVEPLSVAVLCTNIYTHRHGHGQGLGQARRCCAIVAFGSSAGVQIYSYSCSRSCVGDEGTGRLTPLSRSWIPLENPAEVLCFVSPFVPLFGSCRRNNGDDGIGAGTVGAGAGCGGTVGAGEGADRIRLVSSLAIGGRHHCALSFSAAASSASCSKEKERKKEEEGEVEGEQDGSGNGAGLRAQAGLERDSARGFHHRRSGRYMSTDNDNDNDEDDGENEDGVGSHGFRRRQWQQRSQWRNQHQHRPDTQNHHHQRQEKQPKQYPRHVVPLSNNGRHVLYLAHHHLSHPYPPRDWLSGSKRGSGSEFSTRSRSRSRKRSRSTTLCPCLCLCLGEVYEVSPAPAAAAAALPTAGGSNSKAGLFGSGVDGHGDGLREMRVKKVKMGIKTWGVFQGPTGSTSMSLSRSLDEDEDMNGDTNGNVDVGVFKVLQVPIPIPISIPVPTTQPHDHHNYHDHHNRRRHLHHNNDEGVFEKNGDSGCNKPLVLVVVVAAFANQVWGFAVVDMQRDGDGDGDREERKQQKDHCLLGRRGAHAQVQEDEDVNNKEERSVRRIQGIKIGEFARGVVVQDLGLALGRGLGLGRGKSVRVWAWGPSGEENEWEWDVGRVSAWYGWGGGGSGGRGEMEMEEMEMEEWSATHSHGYERECERDCERDQGWEMEGPDGDRDVVMKDYPYSYPYSCSYPYSYPSSVEDVKHGEGEAGLKYADGSPVRFEGGDVVMRDADVEPEEEGDAQGDVEVEVWEMRMDGC